MKKGLPRSDAPRALERRREALRNVVRRIGSQIDKAILNTRQAGMPQFGVTLHVISPGRRSLYHNLD